MKKLLMILLAILLTISFSPIALADGEDYYVEEYDFTVTMPEGWITLTRDLTDDDVEKAGVVLDADELLEQYEYYSIYLYSVRQDPLSEIIVSVLEGSEYRKIHNFNLLDEERLNEIGQVMTGLGGNEAGFGTDEDDLADFEDAQYYGYEIYTYDDIIFLMTDSSQTINGTTVYSKQYTTVVNGELITILFKEYTGLFTPDDVEILKQIAISLDFDEIEEKSTNIFNLPDIGRQAASGLIGALGFVLIGYFMMRNQFKKKQKKK